MSMKPIDFLVIALIAAMLGLVIRYLYKAKKRGVKCIGCPDGAKCTGACSSCSGHCAGCGNPENPK